MTNEELGVHVKYITEYIKEQKEKDIPKRIQDLEFWRKAIIWVAGTLVTVGLFVGTAVYNAILDDVSKKVEIVVDRKIKIAFDNLVIEEVE